MPPAEHLRHVHSSRLLSALLTVLVIAALSSAAVGAHNALHHSQDFQWSGAHLLAQHVDPWAEYLHGDPNHRLIVTQIPNYLAALYLLLLPLGLLSAQAANVVWLVCNLFFAVASGILAARANGLRGRSTLVIVCLLLMSTAARNTLGNGQQGLLVLFLWCLAVPGMASLGGVRSAVAGISYLKFSFAPPLFLYLLLRSGVRAALYSLLPALASIVLVSLWITGPHTAVALLNLALEPFQVARTGFTTLSGDQDLMFFLQSIFHLDFSPSSQGLELAAASSVCLPVAYLAFVVHRGRSAAWHMAVLATMSYSLFKHHAYDGIVLVLPLCFAVKRWSVPAARLVLALLAYFFYGQRVLEAAHLHPQWSHIPEFAMLMVILFAVYRLPDHSTRAAVPLEFPAPAFEEVAVAV